MIPRATTPYRPGLLFFGLLVLLQMLHGVETHRAESVESATARPSLPVPAETGPADEIAIPDDDLVTTGPTVAGHHRISLGRGGTLAGALERLGIDRREAAVLIRALREHVDPGRLPAATGLCAAVDEEGQLLSLAVRSDPDGFYRVRPAGQEGGQPLAERVELPTTVRIESATGEVRHSVRQALDLAEPAEELTLAFADIFQWDIDLLIEPRHGDRVSLVYQIRVLDRAPPDLPSFGSAADTAGQRLGLGRILAASYDGSIARSSAYWVQRADGTGNYFDHVGSPLRKTFLKSPLNYRRISSGFSSGRRHPITRRVVPHHGVDFAAAAGTPVVAAADGRVVAARWDGALGRAVRIRHGSEYVTVYGHLRAFAPGVRAGSEVRQDQVIGYVGATGRATGPHLHYTLIHRGRPIDPMKFRNPPADPLAAELRPQLDRVRRVWGPLLQWDSLSVAGESAPASPDGDLGA